MTTVRKTTLHDEMQREGANWTAPIYVVDDGTEFRDLPSNPIDEAMLLRTIIMKADRVEITEFNCTIGSGPMRLANDELATLRKVSKETRG